MIDEAAVLRAGTPTDTGLLMDDKHYVAVARTEDVPPGKVLAVELDGLSILLCHSNGQIFAVENKCSHADERLECGRMKAGWIACPLHGARFRLDSGTPMNPPATQSIRTFGLRIVGDVVEIETAGAM